MPPLAMNRSVHPEDYADHVEHPRFGKVTRLTGLDVAPDSPAVLRYGERGGCELRNFFVHPRGVLTVVKKWSPRALQRYRPPPEATLAARLT